MPASTRAHAPNAPWMAHDTEEVRGWAEQCGSEGELGDGEAH